MLKDQELVQSVCDDFETADLTDKHKVMLRYLSKVNDTPARVNQADVDAVCAAGWSEAAIYDAVTVCAAFNFFNRWIDATGVPDVPPGFYEGRLEKTGDMGYAM